MDKETFLEIINEYLIDYIDPQYNAVTVVEGLFERLSESLNFEFTDDEAEFEDDEKTFDIDDSEAQEAQEDE
jgi:hypothetical protein